MAVRARATQVFNKRPNKKNFQNRSVSFSDVNEFKHVQGHDLVEINIFNEKAHTRITLEGINFREALKQVEMKDGKKIFVLRY